MKKVPALLAALLTALVAAVVVVAPASAATGYIENSPYSKTYIVVDNYCWAAKLGSSPARLYPGSYTYVNDRGFVVPARHYFSVWKGTSNTPYINNAYSQGNAICYDGATSVHVLVTT